MRRLSSYPRGFHPALLLTLLLLLLSGLLLLPGMLQMRLDLSLDPGWRASGAARLFIAALHALAGFVTIGLVGALAIVHMRMGWRRRLNHVSGIALLSLVVLMLLSTVGIYYAGDEAWSMGSSLVHIVAAILATALFAWHFVKGRKLHRMKEHRAH